MSIELSILKLFTQDRDKQLLHNQHVKEVKGMERDVKLLFGLVNSYYSQNEEKQNVSLEDLLNYHELMYPKAKNRNDIVTLAQTAYSIETNDILIERFLDQLHEKYTANKIVNDLLPVLEGEKYGVLEGLRTDIEDFIDTMHHPPETAAVPVPCGKDVVQLINEEVLEPGLLWRLPKLTGVVGGVRPSTLGLVYAYVDSGKTSFHLDNVAAWSEQLKDNENICVCGNEEKAERLKLRLVQAFLKVNRKWLEVPGNAQEALRRLKGTGFDRINIFDEIVAGDQIKYVLKNYRPSVLVVDQATDVDINTKRKADGVEYMKQLFKWYRRLANQYECGILGVSQGVGDAENTKWLKLSDIYGSRIAIQGALDYAIGIGRKVDDIVLENQRYINIPKNKLYGGEGGKLTVNFNKTICLWQEA